MIPVKNTLILPFACLLALTGGELPTYELPEGPAAKLVRQLDGVEPWAQPFRAWPNNLDASGWERTEPWMEWAKLVRAEAGSEFSKPLRRADLARAAAATGRHDDAWLHFAETESDLSVAAALLPYLFPGVPLDTPPGAELSSGVTLRPLLPPPIERLPLGSFDPAKLSVQNLAIGAARVSVQLELARDGVQIDVAHLSGEPVELSLAMCTPGGYETTVEYLDWTRLGDLGVERSLRSSQDTDEEREHSFWGRFSPSALPWPGISETEAGPLLERIRRIGIAIEAAPAYEARACGLALALEHIFDIHVSERPAGAPTGKPVIAPIVLRLGEENGTAGLRMVMELAERLAFSQ